MSLSRGTCVSMFKYSHKDTEKQARKTKRGRGRETPTLLHFATSFSMIFFNPGTALDLEQSVFFAIFKLAYLASSQNPLLS